MGCDKKDDFWESIKQKMKKDCCISGVCAGITGW